MACLWHDWVRAPRVHVLIFWRDRFRARCIGRVRLAALALPSGLNFGEGKSRISATMQNFSRQDEALRSGEQPRGLTLFRIRSGRLLRSELRQTWGVPIVVFVFETFRLATPTACCSRNRG